MSTNQIRLDELLARNVDVQWFEGVAIVQAICRQLLTTSAPNSRFPTATQIALSADGAVLILDTVATNAVPAAARLLAGLLSDDVPVRLRLAVSQATGESSMVESLREFSETLGYFERPDPDSIVQNLFNRAMLADGRKQAGESGLPDAGAAEQREIAATPPRDMKGMRRRAGIAAAITIAFGAASWLAVSAVNGGGASSAFSGIASALVGSGQVLPEESLENAAPAATQVPKRPRSRSSSTSPSQGPSDGARQESAGRRDRRLPVLVPSFASSTSPMPPDDPSHAPAPAQTYVIEASEPDGSASDPIYSRSDSGVTPPQQVYPVLPANPPATGQKRALTVVDLVIAANGQVERVHLRTTPRDIHEFMLLSAAKAWRFEPALRNGRPVRFLHSVALTSFQ